MKKSNGKPKVQKTKSKGTVNNKRKRSKINKKALKNALNNYVDKFVIVESSFTHSGSKRKLLFDINNYKKFKEKIHYIVLDHDPLGISKISDKDNENSKKSKYTKSSAKK